MNVFKLQTKKPAGQHKGALGASLAAGICLWIALTSFHMKSVAQTDPDVFVSDGNLTDENGESVSYKVLESAGDDDDDFSGASAMSHPAQHSGGSSPRWLYPAQIAQPAAPLAPPVPGVDGVLKTSDFGRPPRMHSSVTNGNEAPRQAQFLGPVEERLAQSPKKTTRKVDCTVTVRESGNIVTTQKVNCTEFDGVAKSAMLVELAGEVPNAYPNMEYSLAVQTEGYTNGLPIVRGTLVASGILGHSQGRRKYESVLQSKKDKTQNLLSFNVEEVTFTVTVRVEES